MQIKFNTVAPLQFANVWYVIALNTSGTGGEPYAINGNQTQNWLDYSFEIIVFQLPGSSAPQAELIQFISQPGIGGGTVKTPSQPLVVTQQQLQLIPNCNGSGTQFCVTVDRHVFAGLINSGATPTPSPTTSPSTSPSPSASPSATPSPPPFGGTWYINWFTVNPANAPQAGGQVIDAPGTGGPLDTTWVPPNPPSHNYDTTTAFDASWQYVAPPGWPQVANQAAQIAGGEVLNNP
jgi:hypothetical protein